MTIGNMAKFAQNAELRRYLFATGNSVLVEASPDDIYWGVGVVSVSANANSSNAFTFIISPERGLGFHSRCQELAWQECAGQNPDQSQRSAQSQVPGRVGSR